MSLYGLINDPFRALQERGHVKPEANGRFAAGPGSCHLDGMRGEHATLTQ
jgi:hypothetical protein